MIVYGRPKINAVVHTAVPLDRWSFSPQIHRLAQTLKLPGGTTIRNLLIAFASMMSALIPEHPAVSGMGGLPPLMALGQYSTYRSKRIPQLTFPC